MRAKTWGDKRSESCPRSSMQIENAKESHVAQPQKTTAMHCPQNLWWLGCVIQQNKERYHSIVADWQYNKWRAVQQTLHLSCNTYLAMCVIEIFPEYSTREVFTSSAHNWEVCQIIPCLFHLLDFIYLLWRCCSILSCTVWDSYLLQHCRLHIYNRFRD